MVRESQSNMWHTSLKHATMLGHTTITSSNNLSAPLRAMLSIGTRILSLVPLIVRNKWSKNFSTTSTAQDVLQAWWNLQIHVSELMIQGFNQGGQRAIGAVKIDLTIEELQSSVWLHVIDAKTSYNILLGRPWVHENKVIPSTYHQFLKYYEDGVAKKIIADNNPFTEAEAHFADAKFYLKKYSTKIDDIASKDDELLNKKSKVGVDKAKVVSKEDPKLGILNKTPNMNNVFSSKKVRSILYYVPKSKKDDDHSLKLQENALGGLTFPVKQIDVMNSSPKSLGKFVALKSSQNEALPTRRTYKGFDLNAYKLLAKAGYNPTEPSKLGKLPLEPAARQRCEGLGYKQPSPICIAIKRAIYNYITAEDESATSNKRSYVFNRLGNSTKRISVFERLGPLRKKTKVLRNNKIMEASALPKSQNAPKDFQSLIPSRMRRQTNVVISCGEVLKPKSHVVVYTKQRDEDEKSVGSSYHVIVQDESELQEDVDGLRTHVINGKLFKKYYP
ncbi:hypothetical protein AABB24_010450 [Solanum stoloniferum]|uniref:Uncharacterized protein n=1 Tax=Solanum stoloniferum TaxID=62892 RepID=A0ABD2U8Y8_9SOLN